MPRIDAEVWLQQRDPVSLWLILERNRFEGAVAVGDADILLPLADVHAWILGVVGETSDPAVMDRWQRHPRFRGVRCGMEGVGEAVRRGLACDLVATPAQTLRVAHAFPAARIAVTLASRELAAAPGVIVKLAGEWPRSLWEAFGVERLMFASQWPRRLPDHTWKETLAEFTQSLGAQSLETRERILGGNAKRFYGLE